jgi:sugar O-acyltransferase (sialic acid O-acetyltransferase NeuD family)
MDTSTDRLVIFGASNILSDLFDCALAQGLTLGKVVIHLPEQTGARDLSVAQRISRLGPNVQPPELVLNFEDFKPSPGELYILGPTSPSRAALAAELKAKFGLMFHTMVHPTAYVSPMAELGEGVFVGANSVVAPGVKLAQHVFVNRGVSIGHDTHVGAFSRLQPGSNLGGLSRIGEAVTVAIGATLIERIEVGDRAFIGAGAVVTADVAADTLVLGGMTRAKRAPT